ncbi:MAG TPA: shikimate dehydrogenase [Kiritimatiellia bacterium]|nr:shikimate dehydrogenase [Kiritimatiellia bacterium]
MKPLSGYTKPYAVLGHPIGHTLSPVMHNASIASLGLDAIYLAFDVHPDRLLPVLEAMQSMGFGGVNLTIPHKEVAFRGLDQLDESARLVGAVNTVAFTPQGLVGHNTDGYGFLKAMEESGGGIEGKRIFVLGAGGAGRAVALVSARAGAAQIALADLDHSRCEAVAAEIHHAAPGIEALLATTPDQQIARCREADIIVQATPVGMKPGDRPLLPSQAFRPGQHAFDLIYMVPETIFMAEARLGGATTANGLGMLLHQGARAFEIWTGQSPDIHAMRTALERAVYPQ